MCVVAIGYVPQLAAANTSLYQAIALWDNIDTRRPDFDAEVAAVAALAVGEWSRVACQPYHCIYIIIMFSSCIALFFI